MSVQQVFDQAAKRCDANAARDEDTFLVRIAGPHKFTGQLRRDNLRVLIHGQQRDFRRGVKRAEMDLW